MILVDTSVWVDHLRRGSRTLADLLAQGRVLCHPFVIGELACGNLRKRSTIIEHLARIVQAPVAKHYEVLSLVERHRLWGTGVGWVDVHLLASVLLGSASLWTTDKVLAEQARRLGVAADI